MSAKYATGRQANGASLEVGATIGLCGTIADGGLAIDVMKSMSDFERAAKGASTSDPPGPGEPAPQVPPPVPDPSEPATPQEDPGWTEPLGIPPGLPPEVPGQGEPPGFPSGPVEIPDSPRQGMRRLDPTGALKRCGKQRSCIAA